MLSVTLPIRAGSIESIQCLADNHPVFLLEGHVNDRIVIKREDLKYGRTSQDVSRNGRVMGAVSPEARAHLADASEVKALEFWARAQIMGASQSERGEIDSFLDDIRSPGSWVKMNYHTLLDLEHAYKKLASQDKSEVREIAKVLNAPGGMEKLGQITAGDMFNGNQDRFVFVFPLDLKQGYGQAYPQGCKRANAGQTNFNHLINFGNIIVTRGSGASPLGLDSWDPNSHFGNWSSQLATVETNAFEKWPGRFLAPNQMQVRKKLAERCVEDLNIVLGERNRRLRILSQVRLNRNAAERMAGGLETGIGMIKNMITSRYRGRAPQGLRQRCAILGWTV